MSSDAVIFRMVATVVLGLAGTAGFIGFTNLVVSVLKWWVGA